MSTNKGLYAPVGDGFTVCPVLSSSDERSITIPQPDSPTDTSLSVTSSESSDYLFIEDAAARLSWITIVSKMFIRNVVCRVKAFLRRFESLIANAGSRILLQSQILTI